MDLAANLLLPSESGGGSIRSEIPWRRSTNARKQQIVMVGIGGSHRHRIIQSADLAACSALRNLQPPAKSPARPKNCQDPSEKSKVIAVDTAPLPRRRTSTKLASFPPCTCYPEDREIEQKKAAQPSGLFLCTHAHPPHPDPGSRLPAPASRLPALFSYTSTVPTVESNTCVPLILSHPASISFHNGYPHRFQNQIHTQRPKIAPPVESNTCMPTPRRGEGEGGTRQFPRALPPRAPGHPLKSVRFQAPIQDLCGSRPRARNSTRRSCRQSKPSVPSRRSDFPGSRRQGPLEPA